MYRKLLSVVLAAMLINTGFIPPRIAYAQDENFFTIAVLNLVANGISESEARSLSEFMRSQITRVATSTEFKDVSDDDLLSF